MALTDSIQAYWNLDESSGNAADSTANNNDLTNNGTATFVAAVIGNGCDLEASSSQYFSIADAAQTGLDFSDAVSFAGWVNFESVSIDQQIITKRVGTGNQRSYNFYFDNALDLLTFLWFTDGSTVGGNEAVSWSPSTATWYHIAVTKSGTSVNFYVNGTQQGTTQSGDNATIYNGTAPFELGAFQTDAQYFDGKMDEWGVWSRELTSGEISQLYNSGAGLTYPFTGSGPANLKSLDTNVKANIKSYNGNVIANVKSINGNS